MKNYFKLMVIIISCIFVAKSCESTNMNIFEYFTASKFSNAGNYMAGLRKISSNNIWYLKNSSTYAKYYNAKKKFIVYLNSPPADAKCYHYQAYIKLTEELKKNSKYQMYYNLLPLEQINDNSVSDFKNECGPFCIVNPAKNELLPLYASRREVSSQIPRILDELKNW